MVKRSHLISICLIVSLIGVPTLSFAKARGGGWRVFPRLTKRRLWKHGQPWFPHLSK